MKTERSFSNNRGSSSIMRGELTAQQIQQFMKTSFYLPIDVLKHPEWVVDRIQVITGKEFKDFCYRLTAHCLEDRELLAAAQFVAMSKRKNIVTGQICQVCKIWYGAEPK